ncbi:MAG: hypothetical protein NVS3B24_03090 [Candidatus Dormibacteria bacterium]
MNHDPARPAQRPGAAFLVFGKILPGALFAFLAVVQLQIVRHEVGAAIASFPQPSSLSFLFNRVAAISFAALIAMVYIVRRPPLNGRRDLPAVLVAMYASFVLLALSPVLHLLSIIPPRLPMPALVISNVLVAVGVAFSVYALLYLRLNFSILPEARGITTSGPYRLVRHPVYLGEIVGAVGLSMSLPSALTLAVLASFIGAQVVRTVMEEKILSTALDGYSDYAARTPRLIPFARK